MCSLWLFHAKTAELTSGNRNRRVRKAENILCLYEVCPVLVKRWEWGALLVFSSRRDQEGKLLRGEGQFHTENGHPPQMSAVLLVGKPREPTLLLAQFWG